VKGDAPTRTLEPMAATTLGAFTVADLEAMPSDGRRYELIGGAIVMTPAPLPPHQRVSRRLAALLERAAGAGFEVFYAPVDIDLPDGSRVQPDVLVAPTASVGKKRVVLPLRLVVEIVSAGSRINDLVTKRTAYADAGIPAYWLIDLTERQITCLRLRRDAAAYEVDAVGPRVEVDWPVTAALDIDELLAPPRP
jgi:Uma2 family endonuclease